jgi:hypothetical protein
MKLSTLLFAICFPGLPGQAPPASGPGGTGETARARPPYVVLASDGSGDFGPGTRGTRTAGWQEALDHCVSQGSDLYVRGGFGGRKAVFHVGDTIRIPPAQDFRIDGGVYVVNWTGPKEKDLLTIDSAMNCEYRLGILVYGGEGAGLRVRPEGPVPIDGFPICVETEIRSEGIADPQPFRRGERKAGTGLVLDATRAPIVHNEIHFSAVLNFRTCIATRGGFSYNRLDCPHLHTNSDRGTLAEIGEGSFGNALRFAIGVDQGADDVTGIVLAGRRNVLDLARRGSDRPFPKGRSLILGASAEGNQVNLTDPDLGDLTESISDLAEVPTNQVTWAGPPLPFREVEFPAGTGSHTQRLFPAAVRTVGTGVKRIRLVRGKGVLEYDDSIGRDIILSVGDRLEVESEESARLQIKPLKTR